MSEINQNHIQREPPNRIKVWDVGGKTFIKYVDESGREYTKCKRDKCNNRLYRDDFSCFMTCDSCWNKFIAEVKWLEDNRIDYR